MNTKRFIISFQITLNVKIDNIDVKKETLKFKSKIYISGLKFLVRICSDLGLPDAHEYATKLKKAEKMKEVQQAVRKSFIKIS